MTEFVIENFGTEQNGYFYYTHKNQHDVIVRKKEVYDGATPSGNSVMAGNLIYLSIIFDNKEWNAMAIDAIKSMAAVIIKYPTSFGVWASSVQAIANGIKEVVLLGEDTGKDLEGLLKKYIPNKVLQVSKEESEKYPLLIGKRLVEGNQFFLCENYSCKEPYRSLTELLSNI